MTALLRCVFALPVLGLLAWLERRRGAAAMTARSRWLARIAGVFLGADLVVWSHSIADIGAGLGTVVTNLQVVLVALLAWAVLRERPRNSLLVALPVMLGGLVLVGGLAGTAGYGAHPALGAAFGVGAAVLYAVYIFMLRQATAAGTTAAGANVEGGATVARHAPVVAPLLEATIGAAFGAGVLGLVLRDFRLGPAWPALGWLLITMSMSKLPAWLIGVLLLVQPAGSLILSAVFLSERPSAPQLVGVAVILVGVLIAARKQSPAARPGIDTQGGQAAARSVTSRRLRSGR